MNPLFARLLRSIHHKEPISGFILLLGATDALIGGFGGRGSLLYLGLLIALLGIIMRWRVGEKSTTQLATKPAKYYLPPGTSRQPLPLLTSSNRRKQ